MGYCRCAASMGASVPLYVLLAVVLFLNTAPSHAQGDAGVLNISQQQQPEAATQQPGALPGALAAGLPATAPGAGGLLLPTAATAVSNSTRNLTNAGLPAAATAAAAALPSATVDALRQRLGITGEPQQASELPGTAITPDPTPWPPTPPGLPPAAWGPGPTAPVEISGSVHVHYLSDLVPYTDAQGRVTSSCIETVERAANYHMRWINIFPLLYWYDPTTSFVPQYYCYKPARWIDGCVRMNATSIAQVRNGLASCVSAAVQKGMHVSFTAHVDDSTASSVAKWRNRLLLDPFQPFGGYSFYDVMLKPVAEASRVALAAGRQVYLATTGEMSGTILAYPNSHYRLIDQLKDVATEGNPIWRDNMQVGISTNFNKFCGCENLWDPWNTTQTPEYEQLKNRFNTTAIADLYKKADFIGVSAYPVLTNPTTFKTDELEWPFWHFARESAYLGVDLKSLLIRHQRKLVVSEYGLGGGCGGDYATVCPNAYEAVKMPYFGTMPIIFGANYTRELDPWLKPDLRSLINLFYIRTTEWLANGGGPHYWVDKLFLWSIGSWDVMGLNKYSYSENGTFQLPEVASRIAEHNYKVNNGLIYSDYFEAGQRRPVAVGAQVPSSG